jgi:ABC-type branched-subunit amino acid transport system ATPase component
MEEFLRLSGVQAYYGESHILHGVDLTVRKGEVVTLLGRNGAGRTTTLKSILGLVGRRTGSILINGVESIRMAPHEIARLGIGYCPEERGIFASLSCEENLKLPPELTPGGRSTRSTSFSPISTSAATAPARDSPAASSRCLPLPASCEPGRACCCSTRYPKAWPR